MSEVKEMMIKLPMVTAASWDELTKARTYPQSGRYIVQLDNGDIVVADVTLPSVKEGEPQTNDEGTASACTCFVGQPVLLNPDEWTLAVDLENARLAYDAELKRKEGQIREANERHEAEMAEQKAKCEALCHETEVNCKTLIDEKEAEISKLEKDNEQKLAMRRMELNAEYEKKKMQLELDTPKRFAQGEWVSGKTLTEIIKTLAGKGKEDAGINN